MKSLFCRATRRHFQVAGAILLATVSSGTSAQAPSLPFDIPIGTMEIGRVYEVAVEVPEQTMAAIELRYYLRLPSRWTHLFDRYTSKEEREIQSILGLEESSETQNLGVPATYRIVVKKIGGEHSVQIVERPISSAIYMGRSAVLSSSLLTKGSYSIAIECVSGSLRLQNLKTVISIAKVHHGK